MENLNIETTQNVNIEFRKASVAERILALLIDNLIWGAVFFFVIIVFGTITGAFETKPSTLLIIVWIVLLLAYSFYHLVMEYFMEGQSLGKKLMKIKVVALNGEEPRLSSYLLRWLLRLVDIDLTSGGAAVLSIIFTKNGQRLGDLAAGTTVIKIGEKVELKDFIYQSFDDNYQVVYPEVEKLNDNDITIVKGLIQAINNENVEPSVITGALKAKTLLEEKMGIQSTMDLNQFFHTLLKDFNKINDI
jgi:uncharacterized RDD family membrane protein YckC